LNDVLEHHLIERQIGEEALQLGILVPQPLQFASLTGRHGAVDLLPAVVGLLRDPDLAIDVADRDAALGLLQDRGDLLDGKALFLHGISLARWAGLCRNPHLPIGPKSRSHSPVPTISAITGPALVYPTRDQRWLGAVSVEAV
jgi:hypothetical protein